jgi:hypothetical protein
MEYRAQAVVEVDSWRDLTLFALGPGLLAAGVAWSYSERPWPVPVAPQALFYQPQLFAPVLALGALGIWLSPRAGLPSAPAFANGSRWLRLVGYSVALGLVFAGISMVLERAAGLSRIGAQALGAPSINVPFPASIAHYAFGSVIQECETRLGPIPILVWLVSTVLMRGRARLTVFWILAVLTSAIEPIAQGMTLAARAPALALVMGGIEFAGNLVWAELFRRYGWLSPLLVRLAMELAWHVAWPLAGGG